MKTNNHARRLILALLLVAVPTTAAWATTRQEAEDAIAKAEATHEQAVAAGAADNQAAEMIEEAKSLMPSRQYTKAQMIAYWAIRQAEFAMKVQSGQETVAEDKEAKLAESMIDAAEKAREKAASVGGEWRDTAKMIKNAQTLAGAGEFQKAIEVASAAKFQAERGYEQAMAEKDAGIPDYMVRGASK